jgi:predicted kinase
VSNGYTGAEREPVSVRFRTAHDSVAVTVRPLAGASVVRQTARARGGSAGDEDFHMLAACRQVKEGRVANAEADIEQAVKKYV